MLSAIGLGSEAQISYEVRRTAAHVGLATRERCRGFQLLRSIAMIFFLDTTGAESTGQHYLKCHH